MSSRATRSRTPVVPAGDPAEPTIADLEVAFLRWLDGRSRSELLHIGDDDLSILPDPAAGGAVRWEAAR